MAQWQDLQIPLLGVDKGIHHVSSSECDQTCSPKQFLEDLISEENVSSAENTLPLTQYSEFNSISDGWWQKQEMVLR